MTTTHKFPTRKPDRILYFGFISLWQEDDHWVASVRLKDDMDMVFSTTGVFTDADLDNLCHAFFKATLERYANTAR